jgi:hypothetical protein
MEIVTLYNCSIGLPDILTADVRPAVGIGYFRSPEDARPAYDRACARLEPGLSPVFLHAPFFALKASVDGKEHYFDLSQCEITVTV